MTTTFDATLHPRATSGQFTDKRNDAPTGQLEPPVDLEALLAEYELPLPEDYAYVASTAPDPDDTARVERQARGIAKLRAAERMFADGVPHPGDDIFETIWTTGEGGHGEAKVLDEIDRHKEMRDQLADGRLRPRDVIGVGYRGDTRKLANEWIDRQQAMFEHALTTRGRSLSINASNVNYRLRNGG